MISTSVAGTKSLLLLALCPFTSPKQPQYPSPGSCTCFFTVQNCPTIQQATYDLLLRQMVSGPGVFWSIVTVPLCPHSRFLGQSATCGVACHNYYKRMTIIINEHSTQGNLLVLHTLFYSVSPPPLTS